DPLRRDERQRRVAGHRLRVRGDEFVELRDGNDVVDDAEPQGLLRVHAPARVEDVLGGRWPDQMHEIPYRLGSVADAELRSRDAELPVLRGNAQVAIQRDS